MKKSAKVTLIYFSWEGEGQGERQLYTDYNAHAQTHILVKLNATSSEGDPISTEVSAAMVTMYMFPGRKKDTDWVASSSPGTTATLEGVSTNVSMLSQKRKNEITNFPTPITICMLSQRSGKQLCLDNT